MKTVSEAIINIDSNINININISSKTRIMKEDWQFMAYQDSV